MNNVDQPFITDGRLFFYANSSQADFSVLDKKPLGNKSAYLRDLKKEREGIRAVLKVTQKTGLSELLIEPNNY